MSTQRLLHLIARLVPLVLFVAACGEPQPTPLADSPAIATTAGTETPTLTPVLAPTPTLTPTLAPSPTPVLTEDAVIEDVAATALEAMSALDWQTYAELVHPEALQDFRDILVTVLEVAGDTDPATETSLVALFDGATDIESVMALEPPAFLAGFMSGVVAQSPQLRETFHGIDVEIIGTVYEGSELAHVVYRTRMSYEGIGLTQTSVVSLKRSDADWRMLLTAELEGLAEQLMLAVSHE